MKHDFKIPMSKPAIGTNEKNAVLKILNGGWFSQGKITEKFESKLSKYLSSNAVVINNGTSALICALMAHNIKFGDKIAVPAFTFIATASAAKILGIDIVPIDIDPNTLNMDIDELEKYVKKNEIKAVIVVDVAGLPINIDNFIELAKRYKFILIEDAAEALGAEYKRMKIGSFKHTTTFSFHIAKAITTIEGGCVTTHDKKILERIKQIRNHGNSGKEKYVHELVGSNFRITDLQSAIGVEQLKKIDKFIHRRNDIAKKYRQNLTNLEFQHIPSYVSKHSYMLFFGIAKNKTQRDEILKRSYKNGIDCRKSWLPINSQPCYPELKNINCKNASKIFKTAFTIPIYNSMTDDEVDYVIDALNN